MRALWWTLLLLPFAGGCVGPHVLGREEASAAIGICFDAGSEAGIRQQVAEQLARQDVELVGCLCECAEPEQSPLLEWRRPTEFEGVPAPEIVVVNWESTFRMVPDVPPE